MDELESGPEAEPTMAPGAGAWASYQFHPRVKVLGRGRRLPELDLGSWDYVEGGDTIARGFTGHRYTDVIVSRAWREGHATAQLLARIPRYVRRPVVEVSLTPMLSTGVELSLYDGFPTRVYRGLVTSIVESPVDSNDDALRYIALRVRVESVWSW